MKNLLVYISFLFLTSSISFGQVKVTHINDRFKVMFNVPDDIASMGDEERLFKHIIKKRPKSLRALTGLAGTYSYQRDFKNSFKYINMALRIDKHYRDGYIMKGTNYM